jgi:glycogen operon protein
VPAGRRGGYLGLIDKIPYLADLGVTAVELMPVFQWDPQEHNYWGYMPMGFFAADRRYARLGEPGAELAEAVAELHRAGIEVWLDVVYNHTAEGDETGPTYSFRGLDDTSYYLHDPADPCRGDPCRYRNDSGTGNVFACARPAPRRLVLDSLLYWAEEIGVAGFRFDLATLLARDERGRPDPDPPLFRDVERFAREAGVRLVAEPWDLGFYALGAAFPGRGWWQWNGRFRDTMRSFVRGDAGLGREPMARLAGSPDLFAGAGSEGAAVLPVNYIACHDGFCLYDLLSYERRRNHANGHGNRDGPADDRSWNHGWEGDEGVPEEVVALRVRQAKNLLGLTLLAAGTPMLLAGDELLDTRFGNSNPYNQDNETSWLDWERRERFAEVHRFVRRMIAFRRARAWLARAPWAGGRAAWHLPDGPPHDPAAAGADPHAFACHLRESAGGVPGGGPGGEELFLAASSAPGERWFDLPAGGGWRRAVDTSLPAPRDAAEPGSEEPVPGPRLRLAPRSLAVLVRRRG